MTSLLQPDRLDLSSVKLLTFDLDNTLWDVWPVIARANTAVRRWLGESYPDLHEHYHDDAVATARELMLEEEPELALQPSRFRRTLMKKVLKDSGLSEQALEAVAGEGFDVFFNERNTIDLFPFATELLQSLSRQYQLIAISNGNADLERIGLRHYFSGHFLAEETLQPKPAPFMFIEALKLAGVKPHEALHIGDHEEEDVDAALAVGMQAVWFNPQGGSRADGVRVVSSLEALHELLDRATER